MRIIVSADDAGASPEVNSGIAKGVARGYVNSVSFMVNGPHFIDAQRKIAATGVDCRKALHLNLVEGKATALGPDSPLVGDSGFFAFQASTLLLAYARSSAAKRSQFVQDIEVEWGAQIDRFLMAFGHNQELNIDSHQHVHVFPFALEALKRAVVTRGTMVNQMRLPQESHWPRPSLHVLRRGYGSSNLAKRLLLNHFSRKATASFRDQSPRLFISRETQETFPAAFCGVLCSGHMSLEVCQEFVRTAAHLSPHGFAEILLHPGGATCSTESWEAAPALARFYLSKWRAKELEVCCDERFGQSLGKQDLPDSGESANCPSTG